MILVLCREDLFHFRHLLDSSQNTQLLRTIELFAFGTFADYYRDPHLFITVLDTPTLAHKLLLLTMLAACQDHEQSLVSQDELMGDTKYALQRALVDCNLGFHDLVVQLVDLNLASLKINEDQSLVHFGQCKVLRDVLGPGQESHVVGGVCLLRDAETKLERLVTRDL